MNNPKFEIELWWPEGWELYDKLTKEEMIEKWIECIANMFDIEPSHVQYIKDKN
jgi:hypothetical protein